jgi:hypothetical protein
MIIVFSCTASKNFLFELYENNELKGFTNCFDYVMSFKSASADHSYKVLSSRYLSEISFLFD